MRYTLFGILLGAIVIGLFIYTRLQTPFVVLHSISIPVEIADTPPTRALGLSGRSLLAPGTGMLFVFQTPGYHSFWMKDMQFPLDILWFDAQGVLVEMIEHAPVLLDDQPLSTYTPHHPITYALELASGFARTYGFEIGDTLTISR